MASRPNNAPPPTVDGALYINRIIWAALLITQGFFAMLAWMVASNVSEPADPMMTWAMLAAALMIAAASYVVKNLLLKQAAQKQELAAVQQAVIVALAVCEGAGILGLFSHFALGSPYSLLFFVVSALGIAGHFPRRSTFEAAAPPKPIV